MTWVDWLIVAFLLGSVIGGFAEGFVRTVVGLIALAVGFLVAAWFYGSAAGAIQPHVHNQTVANMIGFMSIFGLVGIAGAIIGWLLSKLLKIVGLSWLDRLAGGAFGFVRGVLVLAVAALVLGAVMPNRVSRVVPRSELAPHVFEVADTLSELTPYELRTAFAKGYMEAEALIRALESEARHRKQVKQEGSAARN